MTEQQIIDILNTWQTEFAVADILTSFLRRLGFLIAKGIANLAAELENLAKTMYALFPDLIADAGLSEFIAEAKPLLTVLLALAIMATGYIIIVKKEGKSNVLQSFLIIFLVLSVMPMMSTKLATLTSGSAEGIFNITEEGSCAAYDIIDDNITDLYMLMEEDLITSSESEHEKIIKSGSKNVISPTKASVSRVKAASTLDYDENSFGDYDKLVKNELDISASGSEYLTKMNGGIFDASHDYYYRYHINWLVMLTSLIAMFVTLLLTSIRLAKMLWEITLSMFIAPFVAVTDVTTGQRIKELLRNILSLCAVMGIISVILGVYNMGMSILSSWQSSGKIGSIVYLVLLVSLASITIEGPDIVQRIYGISAGGKGPLSMLSGLYYGSRMAKEAAKAPIKAGKAGIKATKKGISLGKKGYDHVTELKNKEAVASGSEKQSSSSAAATDSKTGSGMKSNHTDETLNANVKTVNNTSSSSDIRDHRNLSSDGKKSSGISSNVMHEKQHSAANNGSSKNERLLSNGQRVKSPKVSQIKASPKTNESLQNAANKPIKPLASKNIKNAEQGNDNRIISSLKSKGVMNQQNGQKLSEDPEIKNENLRGSRSDSGKINSKGVKNFGRNRALK